MVANLVVLTVIYWADLSAVEWVEKWAGD